ncbi:hypothetical protein SLEP1_g43104 [Rubroshorea leprosula]|uniref:Uncharacterized protein n=1 Tax=Rubroshorea leprosula TaxID=152421 RepID=A0AAV5LBY6_9ROSI|nr:hypothetical protein SLEP1_g43104 [Rubroshorea leprosula]
MAHHARSNSFPSRSHRLTSEVDEHLIRLASSESASTSSSSLYQKLNDLQDLQDCIQKLLLLPLNQQALGHEQQRKYVDELLNGSSRLIDVCTAVKEALLQTKECTQELQSVLPRRRGAEITQEVKKYLASRKAVKKTVLKALKNLKNKENKCNETGSVLNILHEAQAVTLNVMESLLFFVSGPQAGSKTSRRSAVSKLLQKKRIACEEGEENENEITNAEATLLSIIGGKQALELRMHKLNSKRWSYAFKILKKGLKSSSGS